MKRILVSILAITVLLASACAAPATHTLGASVTPSGAGSVSPSAGEYEEGTQVTLTATPASGYAFDYWEGDASGSSATATITMNSDKSVTAHFVSTSTPAVSQQEVDDARQVVLQYWDAYNSYDTERAVTYLEESYRQEKAERLISEIGRMAAVSVTIEVTEEAEPVVTSEGTIEIRMKLRTPIGAKHMTYYLVKVNGDWKISAAVED